MRDSRAAERRRERAGEAALTTMPRPADDEADPTEEAPAVSVLVLVSERPSDLVDLYRDHAAELTRLGHDFEFIFVLEPWHEAGVAQLEALAKEGEPIRIMRATRGSGEGGLLALGSARARGEVVVTLPGYRRVEASALGDLFVALEDGADVVMARREPRSDSWLNRLQTRLFHLLMAGLTGARFRDVACGVRMFRREVLEAVPLYGDFYRFLPLFARHEGFGVREVDARQHPEDRRTRLHRPGVYARRLIDLLGVFFLTRFTYKPLRFFGLVGTTLTLTGGAVLLVLFVQRVGGQGIADRPMLLLGVLLATLGVQTLALGLIGEIIVHFNAPGRRRYRVVEREDGD